MTREDLPVVVELWRQRLIPEWRVVLMDTKPDWETDDDFYAISQTADDYTEIRVFFTDECLAREDANVHVTIAHELLHALTRPWRTVIDRVEPYLPQLALDHLNAERIHEEEQLVDRLSRLLVAITMPDATNVGPATVHGPPNAASEGTTTTQGWGATSSTGERHRQGAGITGCTGLGSSRPGVPNGQGS